MTLNSATGYEGYIKLCFDKIPRNCNECQIFHAHEKEDERFGFGDNKINFCPFCMDMFGCFVERPNGCPIVKTHKPTVTVGKDFFK